MPPKKNLKRKLQQELGRKQSAPAGKDDIPKSVLLPLVKAAQKHKLGDWQAFIKVKHACLLLVYLQGNAS
jgi:hypothetical protein